MNERKQYTFKNGITATQEECSLKQDKLILKLLTEMDVQGISELENISISELISKLTDSKILEKFFDIILIDVCLPDSYPFETPDWEELKRGEVFEIISDFFYFSSSLIELLRTGKLKTDLLQT